MEFSTVINIVIYILLFRLLIGNLTLLIIKSLFKEDFKYNLKWLNRYLVRKSAYKMVLTLCYVIVLNILSSLNHPFHQSIQLVSMLVLLEVAVFLYYEAPSYGYSEMKHGLGAWRWWIV